MKRPAWQHYPGDWRNNAKLRRCSWGARGVLMEALGLMHNSDEYGVLRWPLKQIAVAIGCPLPLLKELAEKGPLKGSDGQHEAFVYTPVHARKAGKPVTLIEAGPGPCWYSSRMVRDEYIRSKAGESTRFGRTDPREGEAPDTTPSQRKGEQKGERLNAPDPAPSQRAGDGASSSASSSLNGVQTPGIDAGATPTAKPLGDRSPSKTKPENGWHKTRDGQLAMGEYLGLPPKRGEVEAEYRARLFDALNAQQASH